VTVTTAEGLTRSYGMERLATGATRRTRSACCGNEVVATIGTDGSYAVNYPDGTSLGASFGPDPLWGMQAPILNHAAIATPGGLTADITGTRTATVSDPADLFSVQTLTETRSINSRTYTSAYDAATRTWTETTPEGRRAFAVLDEHGRWVSYSLEGLAPLEFEHDADGQLIAIRQGTGPAARALQFTFDALGNPASTTDPAGGVWGYVFDAAERLVVLTRPDGGAVAYQHDGNGNVTAITPPGRAAHLFDYTAADLEAEYVPPLLAAGAGTRYTYDADRRLTRVTRPDGRVIELSYDAEGRLAAVASGGAEIAHTYDAAGRVISAAAFDGGTLVCTYDGFLRTSESWAGAVAGDLARAVNNDFLTASDSVNGGHAVAYVYDRDRLLIQAGELSVTRSAQNGFVTGTGLGGVSTATAYDEFGETSDFNAAFGGNSLYSAQYASDKLGRITTMAETVEEVAASYAYGYDGAGRLVEVRKDGALVAACSYDANGNRLTYSNGSNTVSGTYDAEDRLTQFGTTTYQYSANGELVSKTRDGASTSYGYDPLGNLTSVSLPDGRRVDYILDARLRRIGKKIDGNIVQGFLYSGKLTVVAELDNTGEVASRFVYATRRHVPDYLVRGGRAYLIVGDHLGSPRLVVDAATGTVAQRMDYDVFGNVTLDTNPGFQPFGFAGGLYDRDTKLVHFGAREYDPETGRWTTKDPIDFWGGDTNLYAYVLGDPVNGFDPSGLKPGDLFPTQKEAARQALNDINAKSKSENREYAGGICKKGNEYYYTRPKQLGKAGGTLTFTCPRPTGWYHTHGANAPGNPFENLSDKDWKMSMDNNITGYLATPNDAFKGIRKMSAAGGIDVWGDESYGKL